MKKKILVTESELVRIINRIISEQQPGPVAASPSSKGLNLRQNVVTGYGNQGAQQSGQKAKQAVVQTASKVLQAGKQVTIKIGNTVLNVVTIGGAVLWLIGESVFKISSAISNEILKLLTSTGKVVVGAATQLSQQSSQALTKAGIALNKGAEYVAKQVSSMADSSMKAVTYVLDLMKQFGAKTWAQILAGASALAALKGQLDNWLKSKWAGIQNQVGMAWDQAKASASGAFQTAKDYAGKVGSSISNKASQIKQGATDFANKAANYAGQAGAWLKGFMSELFNRYHSFQGNDLISVLSEARQFNGKAIIL
jgi:hypothetical protein